MVSSRFSGKQSIKIPAICHKELYGLPDVYVTTLPTQLSALAVWNDSLIPVAIAESFPLFWSGAIPGWTGKSGDIGSNLVVTIKTTGVEAIYDFYLELRDGDTVLDDDSWHGRTVFPARPFDPGLLRHVYHWPTNYNELRILN